MKIFSKILMGFGVAAALFMTSCSLDSVSKSTFEDRDVYSDPTLTQYAIYSIYEVFGHTNSHRGRYLPYYGYNTDIEWATSNTITNATTQIMRYNSAANNSTMNVSGSPYDELFAGVERANLCIEGIRAYGNVDNDAQMASLLGEALCARALLYIELLKGYGEVPARFEPANSDNMYQDKADKDVIYKQILADIEESFDYMDYNTTTRTDKIGLAFAKGLYARIALYASGYSQRPDEGNVGGANNDPGTVRLSNDPDLQKSVLYPKALTALKDVIDNSGLYLMDYKTMWWNQNNLNNLTYGPEVMFVIPFSNTRGRWNYTHAIRHEGYDAYNPTTSSRGGTSGAVPYVYYWYGDNDVRRDLSVVNYCWDPEVNSNYPTPAGIANWYFAKYRLEWMQSYPYDGGNDDGVKPVYMRYADILLMAAEIANSSEGGNDQNYAKQCLKTVMERAYANNPSEGDAEVDALSGQSEIFEYIKKQRALEFVGEFLRKADLIRWNELKTKMDDACDELAAMRTGKVGNITGVDYSQLFNPDNTSESSSEPRQYVWYYTYTDDDKIPCVYIYGIHLGETECSATDTPPGAYNWTPYTNSDGEVSSYISSSSFTSSSNNLDRTNKGIGGGFYDNDPNTKQYWPIPEITITNAQGSLNNDYGY